MPLIACDECGKEISSRVDSCPHCGCPSEYAFESHRKEREPLEPEPVFDRPEPDISNPHDDEQFYEQVAVELKEDNIRKGLWLKAETKAKADANKTRLLYIEWRVEQLIEGERAAQQQKEERLANEAAECKTHQQKQKEGRLTKKAAERETHQQREMKGWLQREKEAAEQQHKERGRGF